MPSAVSVFTNTLALTAPAAGCWPEIADTIKRPSCLYLWHRIEWFQTVSGQHYCRIRNDQERFREWLLVIEPEAAGWYVWIALCEADENDSARDAPKVDGTRLYPSVAEAKRAAWNALEWASGPG